MTPNLEEIKAHFAKAKEIKCLGTGQVVNVSQVKSYAFDAEANSWSSIGGAVIFWQAGQYADITKTKCVAGCKDCKPCAEKRKNGKI